MIGEGVLDAAGPRVARRTGCTCSPACCPRGVFATRPGTADGRRRPACRSRCAARAGTARGRTRPPTRSRPRPRWSRRCRRMVTRQFDVFDPVVITVGMFHAGTRRNIIPDEARFEATMRTLLRRERGPSCASGVDAAVRRASPPRTGWSVEVSFTGGVPGDRQRRRRGRLRARRGRRGVRRGPRRATLPDPIMGSEDFSRVLAEVPGAFVFLGACAGERPEHRAGQPLARAPGSTTACCRTRPCCWPSWPGASWATEPVSSGPSGTASARAIAPPRV